MRLALRQIKTLCGFHPQDPVVAFIQFAMIPALVHHSAPSPPVSRWHAMFHL